MHRIFLRCKICDLVFVPEQFHVTEEVEKQRYLQHNNQIDDPEYRSFLQRMWYQLKPRLKPGSTGLDFGSGPGPALSAMMKENGFNILTYDKYFQPDRSVLKTQYEFITSTETVEHLSNPREIFDLFHRILKPSGWIGLMTSMLDNWSEFSDWHYHRDPTHVSFYSKSSMQWVANQFGWHTIFPVTNVVLFRNNNIQSSEPNKIVNRVLN